MMKEGGSNINMAAKPKDHLFQLVRDCFKWVEACPCHGHLDHQRFDSAVLQRWARCPPKGLQLPELAAGDFFTTF